MNTLTDNDKAYIAFITGNSCHAHVWTILSSYGCEEMYGGTGAPTHLIPEEVDEYFELRELEYHDQRWKDLRNRLISENKCCAKCGDTYRLEAHHKLYIRDKRIWEYQDSQLEVLCKKCHLEKHGLKMQLNGVIVPL